MHGMGIDQATHCQLSFLSSAATAESQQCLVRLLSLGIYTRVTGYISWIDDLMKNPASDQSIHYKPFPQGLMGSRANERSVSGVIFFGEFLLLLLLFGSSRRA